MYKIEDGVTQSLLSAWLDCRQRAWYKINGYYVPKYTESLLFGNCFHYLLEQLYKLFQDGTITSRTPIKVMIAMGNEAISEWMDTELKEASGPDHNDTLEHVSLLSSAVLRGYIKRYKLTDFKTVKWIGQESLFDIDFKGFRLRGKRDGEFEAGRSLYLLENKTKGRIDEGTLTDNLTFDLQNLMYLLSLFLEQRKVVTKVRYNIIRKPQIKETKAIAGAAYYKRVEEDVLSRPEFYFVRWDLVYTKAEQKQFQRDLHAMLKEFKQWVDGDIPTFKNDKACVGRKFNCDFLTACASKSTDCLLQRDTLFPELETN